MGDYYEDGEVWVTAYALVWVDGDGKDIIHTSVLKMWLDQLPRRKFVSAEAQKYIHPCLHLASVQTRHRLFLLGLVIILSERWIFFIEYGLGLVIILSERWIFFIDIRLHTTPINKKGYSQGWTEVSLLLSFIVPYL